MPKIHYVALQFIVCRVGLHEAVAILGEHQNIHKQWKQLPDL